MDERSTDSLAPVEEYFSRRIATFGPTALGVDWSTDQRQQLCFDQLAKLFTHGGGFSVGDLGCGYGAFYDYVATRFHDVSYDGYDISSAMIRTAEDLHRDRSRARFHQSPRPLHESTYGIACGIFNVRLDCEDAEWTAHIHHTLDVMHECSAEGFAFNCLTTYSDSHLLKPHLYYADPNRMFDHCKRRFSRNVALLHDYDAYEFTILVRKGRV